MAVTLKPVNNIYADWISDSYTVEGQTHYIINDVGYYIVPSKLTYNNIDWNRSSIGTGWVEKGVHGSSTTPVRILLVNSAEYLYNQHTFGFSIGAYSSGNPVHAVITAPLVLTFYRAAQNIRTGKLHDLRFTVTGVDAYSRSTAARYIALINLTDEGYTYNGHPGESGFLVQSQVEQASGSDSDNRKLGVDVRMSFQVLDAVGESVDPQARFPYPFQDIDFVYDAITDSDIVNGACSESVQLMQGWANPAYVYNGSDSAHVNWLTCTADSATYPNRIYNSQNSTDDTPGSTHTSMVCLLNSGGSDESAKNIVRWFGSACSTSLQGKNIATYSVTVNANGGQFVIGDTTTSSPQTTYKLHGVDVGVSYTLQRPGHTCIGYSTDPNAVTATYPVSFTYTSNANITLYAVWEQSSSPVWIRTNNGWQPYIPTDPQDPSANGYIWQVQNGAWKLVKPAYICKTVGGVKQWVNMDTLL